MTKLTKKVISSNKKAFHDFIICERYTAGIVLMGTEIKSIRKGGINLKDSFAKIEDMEAFLHHQPSQISGDERVLCGGPCATGTAA